MGMGYAILDEIHQLFIDGRAGQVRDVLIDTIGIALGVWIVLIMRKIVFYIVKKRKEGVCHKQE